MAKKTIECLKPNDEVWAMFKGEIYSDKIYSISTDELKTKNGYLVKISKHDFTSWLFEAENRQGTKMNFHLNYIDVLKLRHKKLEEDLEQIYERQKNYFVSIMSANKRIHESNLEIINQLNKKLCQQQ